jgi:hypothetical protein
MTVLKNFTTITEILALEASEDMDNAYRFVKQGATNTDTADLCDTAGERPIGVIDRNYDDDDHMSIITKGFATVVAGAAVAAGAQVVTDASARAITATALHDWIAGIAFNAASAAGDEIVVLIDIRPNGSAGAFGYGTKIMSAQIAAAGSGFAAETDLFTLPAKAVVVAAFVRVTTAEATGTTKTVDVGTSTVSNDPDGFLDGVSVAATGIVKGTLLNTGQTMGALLSVDEDGAGALVREEDITSFGAVVSASPGSADFAELVAEVSVVYYEIG